MGGTMGGLRRYLLLISCLIAALLTLTSAQTLLIGSPGTGKTHIINAITGSLFNTSSSIETCTRGVNSMDKIHDVEGFDGIGGTSKHSIFTFIFDVIDEAKSIQNIVWVKPCSIGRMPAPIKQLIVHLKRMGVTYNLIVHDNFCNGNCSTCSLDIAGVEDIYPLTARMFTHHTNGDPSTPDWDRLRIDYKAVTRLYPHSVDLPPNYLAVLREDDYEFKMHTWISNNCTRVIHNTEHTLLSIKSARDEVGSAIIVTKAEPCNSQGEKVDVVCLDEPFCEQCGTHQKCVLFVCWGKKYCPAMRKVCNRVTIADQGMRDAHNLVCANNIATRIASLQLQLAMLQADIQVEEAGAAYVSCLRVMHI